MGASGWTYFVPYQSDINQALHDLHQAVFDSGMYYTEEAFVSGLRTMMEHTDSEYAQPIKDLLADLPLETETIPPATIAELLERNGESGTHSILDITQISSTPGFCAAAPLSEQQLLDIFGTTQPTHQMIEQHLDQVQALRRSWEGTYIIVYEDDTPFEILFTGFSGD